jgi:hypothetical protein
MLEGYDNGWVDANFRRTAFYTNLPPGNFRFHVIAANNDGVWNSKGATLQIRVITKILSDMVVLHVGDISCNVVYFHYLQRSHRSFEVAP